MAVIQVQNLNCGRVIVDKVTFRLTLSRDLVK